MKMMGDPDCDFLAVSAAEGVPIGVDVELPRTPAVFEEKNDGNFESAGRHLEDIRRQIVEDVTAGAAVRMSVAAAKRKYGSRLTISCLGAVLKEPGSEVVRILFDGTNGVHTNDRIRVRNRAHCPMIEDLEAQLRELEDAGGGEQHFVVVYDISKAHRLGPVREADWALQTFRLTGRPKDSVEGSMYSCGTFGGTSAAHWWARVSAAMVRLLHCGLGPLWALWHLLFAEDGLAITRGSKCRESFRLMFLILETYGFPGPWHKVRAGTRIEWVGYQLEVSSFEGGTATGIVSGGCHG